METTTIPNTPNNQPKEDFKITKKTHAKSMIVATSFHTRKKNEVYFFKEFYT